VLLIDEGMDTDPKALPLFLNGSPALVCRISGEHHELFFFGKSFPADQLLEGDQVRLLVFFFRPFLLAPVFKLSALQLKSGPVKLDLWHAQKNMAVQLQLINACTIEEKTAVLNHFILSQADANRYETAIIQQATDKLLYDTHADLLKTIHKELNLTERTFQRIFKKYVGVAPNEYRRICQFQMAFFQLKGGHYQKLADIAYDQGYFDQSHYIRSFKEFMGSTPQEYLQFGLRPR
jgi:AraC-like DNA-binding protein